MCKRCRSLSLAWLLLSSRAHCVSQYLLIPTNAEFRKCWRCFRSSPARRTASLNFSKVRIFCIELHSRSHFAVVEEIRAKIAEQESASEGRVVFGSTVGVSVTSFACFCSSLGTVSDGACWDRSSRWQPPTVHRQRRFAVGCELTASSQM